MCILFPFQQPKEIRNTTVKYAQGVEWGYCSPHCTEQAEKVKQQMFISVEIHYLFLKLEGANKLKFLK